MYLEPYSEKLLKCWQSQKLFASILRVNSKNAVEVHAGMQHAENTAVLFVTLVNNLWRLWLGALEETPALTIPSVQREV